MCRDFLLKRIPAHGTKIKENERVMHIKCKYSHIFNEKYNHKRKRLILHQLHKWLENIFDDNNNYDEKKRIRINAKIYKKNNNDLGIQMMMQTYKILIIHR